MGHLQVLMDVYGVTTTFYKVSPEQQQEQEQEQQEQEQLTNS